MATLAAQHNANLSLAGKTAVVSGGTQGIGAAVALRFAQLGCERVFVVGRDETRAQALLERIEKTGAQGGFVKADLSSIGGIKTAAIDVKKMAGIKGIDYMVMTQGGVPNGIYKAGVEGLDVSFAVQGFSRFGLAYLLSSEKTFNKGAAVVSVAAPGRNYDLDLEDIDLKKRHESGRSRLLYLVDQGKRDSVVLDSMTEELNTRFPNTRFYHLFPGFVATNGPANRGLPFPLSQISSLIGSLIATAPETYADVPIFVAAHPEAKQTIGEGKRFNEQLKPVEMGVWAKEVDNRRKLWEKMTGWIGTFSFRKEVTRFGTSA